MLHAILDRMKCEAEKRTEERACEAVANARHVHEEVNKKRFDDCIGEEEQRRRHAVNESLADNEHWADRTGIEHRSGNADDQSEAIRGIDGHRENDAQSWRAGAVQNSIHALSNQPDHKSGQSRFEEPQYLAPRLSITRPIHNVEVHKPSQHDDEADRFREMPIINKHSQERRDRDEHPHGPSAEEENQHDPQ